jgi:hypothetical protein
MRNPCVNLAVIAVFMSLCEMLATQPTSFTNDKLKSDGKSEKPLCTEYREGNLGSGISGERSRWVNRKDRSREYVIDSCNLKRFTSKEANKGLKDRHILFMGDSLTRYQFLSLVFFLEHGKWPPRFKMEERCTHIDNHAQPTCSKYGEPSLLAEFDWAQIYGHAVDKSWKQMHMTLGGGGFHGRLECQCVRDAPRSAENMFYRGRSGVKVTLLQMLSDDISGFRRNGCAELGTCNYTSDEWFALRSLARGAGFDWTFKTSSPEFYSLLGSPDMLPDVDVALINRGIWGGIPHDSVVAHQQLTQLRKYVDRGRAVKDNGTGKKKRGRCFWKTTTAVLSLTLVPSAKRTPQLFEDMETNLRQIAHTAGCETFDTAHITSDLIRMRNQDKDKEDVYWDIVHFQPWMYEELNVVLLNTLISTSLS